MILKASSACFDLSTTWPVNTGEPEEEQYVQAPIQKEKFYTEGSPALKAARLQVLVCTLFLVLTTQGSVVLTVAIGCLHHLQ